MLLPGLASLTLIKLYQIPEGKLRSEICGTESDFECHETQPFVPIDTDLNVLLLTLHEDGDYDMKGQNGTKIKGHDFHFSLIQTW